MDCDKSLMEVHDLEANAKAVMNYLPPDAWADELSDLLLSHGSDEADAPTPTLPPDAWAMVMKYLPLSDVISIASTCRANYFDAVPLVTSLHIRRPKEMSSKISMRFRDVREIFIYSLVEVQYLPIMDDDDSDMDHDFEEVYTINFETSARVSSFLSNSFPKLERVFLGGGVDDEDEEDDILTPYVEIPRGSNILFDSSHGNMSRLIDSISAAFRCGSLPPNLSVRGLRCMRSGLMRAVDCPTCRRACESFPLRSVAMFESKGSSQDQVDSARPYDLDCCLGREEIEQIIQTRAGGHDILRSKERILNLLGRGKIHLFHPDSDDGETVTMIFFSRDQLTELDRVIKNSQHDVSKWTAEELNEAIMKSSSCDERYPTSSTLLSEKSREHLEKKLGLPCQENPDQFRNTAMKILNRIVRQIRWCGEPIREECMSLLFKLVSLKEKAPIQAVVASGIIPDLNDSMAVNYAIYSRSMAVRILTALLLKMRKSSNAACEGSLASADEWPTTISNIVCGEHIQSSDQEMIGSQIIPFIVHSIKNNATECIRDISACLLSEFVKKDRLDQVEPIVKAGGISAFISFLEEKKDDKCAPRVLLALSVIANSSPAYLDVAIKAGIITIFKSDTHISNRRLSENWVTHFHDVVTNEQNLPHLREIFDSGCIPSLIETAKRYSDANLATTLKLQSLDILNVILTKHRCDYVINEIVNAGAIPMLVDCTRDYRALSIQKAVYVLSVIADASIAYRDEVLKSEVFAVLAPRLRSSSTIKGPPLKLIHAMGRHGKNKGLVEKIMDIGLVPSLLTEIGPMGGASITKLCAITTLAIVLGEELSTTQSLVVAQTILGDGIITSLGICLEQEVSNDYGNLIVQNALFALTKIAEHSHVLRNMVALATLCRLSKVDLNCPEVTSRWVDFIHSMTVLHKPSINDVQSLIDSSVVDTLVVLLRANKLLKAKVATILNSVKSKYIEQKSKRIELLQKKRAWLIVCAVSREVGRLRRRRKELKLLLADKSTPAAVNARWHNKSQLDQVSSQLDSAKCTLERLRKEAQIIAPRGQHEQDDTIHEFIADVDDEIKMCKLAIGEIKTICSVSQSKQRTNSKSDCPTLKPKYSSFAFLEMVEKQRVDINQS